MQRRRTRRRLTGWVRGTFLVLVAVLASTVRLPGAAAQEAPPAEDYARDGAFAGLGFSAFVSGFQDELLPLEFGDSLGFNARGGYRFAPWFAAEGVVEYANKFGADQPGATAEIEALTTTVNAKFILPLERLQPYLSVGTGLLRVSSVGTGFASEVGDLDLGLAGRIGGGLDFYLTPHWSVYVDNAWTMATKKTPGVYYYSLGLGGRYNF